MINPKKYLVRICFCLLALVFFSCQSEVTKKANEVKADSLESQTKHAMDSANDAIMKQMNSVDDSEIINDPASPTK